MTKENYTHVIVCLLDRINILNKCLEDIEHIGDDISGELIKKYWDDEHELFEADFQKEWNDKIKKIMYLASNGKCLGQYNDTKYLDIR